MSGLRVRGIEVGSPSPFLIFAVARSVGRKSATAAAITTTSAAFAASSTASRISRVVCTRRSVDRSGRIEVGDRARDERHIGAALGRDPGQRVPLTARRTVAQGAHGVERLGGAAGRDDHAAALEVARQRERLVVRQAPLEQEAGELGDLGGLGQTPGAGVGAGEATGGGLEDDGAPAAQGGDVVDGRRVLPHLGVHRGDGEHRTSRGEQRRRQQVVGAPVGHPGQQVRGGGRRSRRGRHAARGRRAPPRRRSRRPR